MHVHRWVLFSYTCVVRVLTFSEISMNKTLLLFRVVCLSMFLAFAAPATAGITDPCLSVPIPLQQRVDASSMVVHGRVVQQRVVWDDAHRSIYTLSKLRVHDLWSKSVANVPDTIVVLTEGGSMGVMGRTVMGALQLMLNDEGYLLIESAREADVSFKKSGEDRVYRPYAETQAFLEATPLGALRDCWGSVSYSAEKFESMALRAFNHEVRAARSALAPAAVSTPPQIVVQGAVTIAPERVAGGAADTVVVRGTGFGDQRGDSYVTFVIKDTTYMDAASARGLMYRSWSDTMIVVEVPPSLSGALRVVVGGIAYQSSQTLHVMTNLYTRTLNPLTYTHLVARNANGGYTWSIDSALFNNPEARECVESVMKEFRCKTGMNYQVDSVANITGYSLGDAVNALVFDAPGYELGAGAVAYCDWVWYSCILGNTTFYYIPAADCRLSRKFNWYYGRGKNPSFGMAKLRYVLFHEIGHSHQFAHVSEEGESMHPIVQALPAEKWLERDTITASEQRTGRYFTKVCRDVTFNGCGIVALKAPLVNDCNTVSAVPADAPESLLRVLPQPAVNTLLVQTGDIKTSMAQARVMDATGKCMDVSLALDPFSTRELYVGHWPPGMYVLTMQLQGSAISLPFVIQR
ncbi:MAG: hypothetical protein RL156_1814 [Bacteroidota bacterium]